MLRLDNASFYVNIPTLIFLIGRKNIRLAVRT
jgi:hypothetical protein